MYPTPTVQRVCWANTRILICPWHAPLLFLSSALAPSINETIFHIGCNDICPPSLRIVSYFMLFYICHQRVRHVVRVWKQQFWQHGAVIWTPARVQFCPVNGVTANALWVKHCWKVEIEELTKMFPSGPIFMNLNYFRQNIWRLSSVQFHFWYIFGTSWTQPTAGEGFTIESVSIQAGCWRIWINFRDELNTSLKTGHQIF